MQPHRLSPPLHLVHSLPPGHLCAAQSFGSVLASSQRLCIGRLAQTAVDSRVLPVLK